jgi:hypothetical protein
MELFHALEPKIRKHASTPNIEIEIRIGKINRNSFDTDLTKGTYEKILRRLRRYKAWESVTEYDTTVFYFQNGGRVTYDNVLDQEIESIIKKPIEKFNFPLEGQPFDVRLGISTEEPFERDEDEQAVSSRTKNRVSFLRKNLKIDVTAVTGDPDDPDSEAETQYQVELEIVKVPDSRDELFNMVHKVFDVLKISK